MAANRKEAPLMHGSFDSDSNKVPCVITFSPSELVRHHVVAWQGITGDVIQTTTQSRLQYDYRSCCHLLIASETAGRYDGEITVDGMPKSKIRQLSRKLSFIPAGHHIHGWKKPSAPAGAVYFYLDPHGPLVDPELRFAETDFKPRLFFFDRDLWETAMKLKTQVENGGAGGRQYVEALSVALAHELVRVNDGRSVELALRGGLAGWQQKRVSDYIEENVAEEISLATLAGLVQLSPYHFSRAFKRSFGMPPHRYHVSRRVERAKDMLAGRELSVTEIAFKVGFGEGSSLTDAFRKFTGRTPIDYRRATA
jgi:AraC family transcriptional regulator